MKLEKREIGWDGEYEWLLDGKRTYLPEPVLIAAMPRTEYNRYDKAYHGVGVYSVNEIKS